MKVTTQILLTLKLAIGLVTAQNGTQNGLQRRSFKVLLFRLTITRHLVQRHDMGQCHRKGN